MTTTAVAGAFLVLAFAGVALLALQLSVMVRYLRAVPPKPERTPGISVLKPLCGVDDDLRQNLESFARLDYPSYEVLLGVKDASDAAYPFT